MTSTTSYIKGDLVRHERFGVGNVVVDEEITAVIRFRHGIEECEKLSLCPVIGFDKRLRQSTWDKPGEVINRLQAEAIRSINDTWGVFSRARIELLPHQLWVCRRVNATWPCRWLVADDVGLGKTIEAGMVLWPLLANGTVKRLLILCPAQLVDQWQYRMREMFDIRLAIYTADQDTDRRKFWTTHQQVVASFHTLRLDRNGRWDRMIDDEPWDLVIVDEAHHLNANEHGGMTLGYELMNTLTTNDKITSMLFFTGTPHRGKDYGFLSLLKLLKPDMFNPKASLEEQLQYLPEVVIRNNKCNVTDLHGNRLFQSPNVTSEEYHYSPQEQEFYNQLTHFIETGRAYASRLSHSEGEAVKLVLTTMQKLASSSVAAIRRALNRRLNRLLNDVKNSIAGNPVSTSSYEDAESTGNFDQLAQQEEEMATSAMLLMQNEIPSLRTLIQVADAIIDETKMSAILKSIEERFTDRSILFFTEYKATQGLLMSALIKRYGTDSVTFINGDERLDDVVMPNGELSTISVKREDAAQKINSGEVRFLISTEAGGEGIDLQERCHTLIHVDLPWNPMRLHQRVGRVNRYGQKHRVDVLTFRNPDTIESNVWEKLNNKLERITLALGQVMDEPEDLLQLVLGMTSSTFFREVFSEGTHMPRERLDEWFDSKSTTFGGDDVINTVTQLIGHSNKFDYKQMSSLLPQVDLPDLQPYFELALSLNGKRIKKDGNSLSFNTPESWRANRHIQVSYDGMMFNRLDKSKGSSKRLLGIGHKLFDTSLDDALKREAFITKFPKDILTHPVIIYRVQDRVTGESSHQRSIIVGIQVQSDLSNAEVLQDWQLLKQLNELITVRRAVLGENTTGLNDCAPVLNTIDIADKCLVVKLESLDHRFKVPYWDILAVLWSDFDNI